LKILCVIPAFEEEATIGKIAEVASKYCHRVVVVDDCSGDRTGEASRQAKAVVVRHILRLGAGGALSTGFRVALKIDCDIVVTMDGDGQHDPHEIPNLIDPILNDQADMVVGSRFLRERRDMPFDRRLGNRLLSAATSLAAGVKITDSQSGFRAYRRKVLDYVVHRSMDYRWASEILIAACRAHFRIKEVPIRTIYVRNRRRGANISDGLKILFSTARHEHR